MWLLSLTALSCSRAHKNTADASGGEAAPAPVPVDGTSEDASESTEPAPNPGFAQGQQPVPTTGSNLVDVANGRVRCSYSDAAAAHVYHTECLLVVHPATGSETLAAGISSGVTVAWTEPQSLRGAQSYSNCTASANLLSYQCDVTVTDTALLAESRFGVAISSGSHATSTQTADVLLPYGVGVAAGFIPNLPYQYQARSLAASAAATVAGSAAPAGFQTLPFGISNLSLNHPMMCQRDTRLFFADGYSVYQLSHGQVTLYAGSPNVENLFNTSDKLRIYLAPDTIACSADAVYVASDDTERLYKLTDDGGVVVIAGNGDEATTPDGVAAMGAAVNDPWGLALDAQGNLLFAEVGSGLVRRISAAGKLQTVAGGGTATADGVLATASQLQQPMSLTVDGNGTLYILDTSTLLIRSVDSQGRIATRAGTGKQRYATTPGDPRALAEPQALAVDAAGNLFVSELFRGIKEVLANGDLRPVVSAGADLPYSTSDAEDQASVQMEDLQGAPLFLQLEARPGFSTLMIDKATGAFYADSISAVLSFPNPGSAGLADPATPTLGTTVVGNQSTTATDCTTPQPAVMLQLYEAAALGYRSDGALLVADWQGRLSNQVLVHQIVAGAAGGAVGSAQALAVGGCTASGQRAGVNNALDAVANGIGGLLAVDGGGYVLANAAQNRIYSVSPGGALTVLAGTGAPAFAADGALASHAPVNTPMSLSRGPDGSLYFVEYPLVAANELNDLAKIVSKVRRILPNGTLVTIAGNGAAGDAPDGELATQAPLSAMAVAVASDGRVFLADPAAGKIRMVDTAGKMHTIAGGGAVVTTSNAAGNVPAGIDALSAQLSQPTSIAVSNDGSVYFVDWDSQQVLQLKPRASGGWTLDVLMGIGRTSDCSTSVVAGTSSAAGLDTVIKSSLSIICEAEPKAVAVYDTCPAPGGQTRIAISQVAEGYANIVEIVKGCGT